MAKRALGRGLGALIGSSETALTSTETPNPVHLRETASIEDALRSSEGEVVREVRLDDVISNPNQPRKTFQPEELEELERSIREVGLLQPLIVRPRGEKFEIIAGERRWRASRLAGLERVPVIVREADELQTLEWAMVENLQRSDLNPIEEAEGYGMLAEKFDLSQEDIARRVGKNRATVANALRLRKLAPTVKEYVRQNHLSVGHAKVILSLTTPEEQEIAAEQVLKRGLSVRQTESLVISLQKGAPRKNGRTRSSNSSSADWRDLEQNLQRTLGTKVKLIGTAERGRLEIEFYHSADLERILHQLGVRPEED